MLHNKGVYSDLAALLWGEVDDLFLPLDSRRSRVALAWLGSRGLCNNIKQSQGWWQTHGQTLQHRNAADNLTDLYATKPPGSTQDSLYFNFAFSSSINKIPDQLSSKAKSHQTQICLPCWLCLLSARCAAWKSPEVNLGLNGTIV